MFFNNEKGQALIMVIFMAVIIFFIGTAALTMGTTVRKTSIYEVTRDRAYYVAEAGVEKALDKAMHGVTAGGDIWLDSLGSNTTINVTVTLSEFAGTYPAGDANGYIEEVKLTRHSYNPDDNRIPITIQSRGRYSDSKKSLTVDADLYLLVDFRRGVWFQDPNSEFGNNSMINSPVSATGDIEFKQNCVVNGQVRANGNIQIDNNVTVTPPAGGSFNIWGGGNLTLLQNGQLDGSPNICGHVYLDNGAKVGHTEAHGINEVFVGQDIYLEGPVTDVTDLSSGGMDSSKVHPYSVASGPNVAAISVIPQELLKGSATHWSFNPDTDFALLNGVYYVDGDLTINGNYNYNGVGVIVVSGKITISNGKKILGANSSSSLVLVSYSTCTGPNQGGIEIGENSDVRAILYCPTKIFIGNGAKIYGSLISNLVEINPNQHTEITYDPNLGFYYNKNIGRTKKITSWKETP